MIKTKKFFIESLILIFIIFFGIFLVRHPDLSFLGVKEGFEICFETLVPSLFPFIFFASFIINSGASNILGRIFSKISEKIFLLPPETAPVILLSMIGGFPVGAKGISELLDKKIINSKQAERMLKFCVNAGPAFILGVIGNSLIKNLKIAGIILISQIVSSLIIAIFLAILEKNNKNKNLNKNFNNKNNKILFAEALIKSCESASLVIINMCFLVIIFNILYIFLCNLQINYFCDKILSGLGLPKEISVYFFQIIMEVTKSCQVISNYNNYNYNNYCNYDIFPELLAFATSWGGLCVHFQIFSILKNLKINYLNFFVFRFINALLSSFLTFLIIKTQNINININPNIYFNNFPKTSTNILGSIMLVLCCLVFLLDLNFKKKSVN